MRVLVAGSSGQLARSLAAAAPHYADLTLVSLGRPELDLLDMASITTAIKDFQPDIVINAAAYTAVDRAEQEAVAAFAINCEGAGKLAQAAAACGAPIIHISTDYVFDGGKPDAYLETDAPNPQTVYGQSKYDGELSVADANPQHIIFRTSWVYSEYGNNFVKTMLRLAAERPELRVVADQFGNPTHAGDLSIAILDLIGRLAQIEDAWGLYHLAGQGETNWHGFAEQIMVSSQHCGGASVPVLPITTAEFPTPAKRPANSRLDSSKAREKFGVLLPVWTDAVNRCVTQLCAEEPVRAERA